MTTEPWRKLVRARMSGLLTIEEVHGFARDFRAAAAAMGLGPDEFSLLVETEGNIVQQQQVMSVFQELLSRPQVRARKVAIVRRGTLGRMQARRLTEQRTSAQVFDNLNDAELWLRAA